jgi:hypothetical protein
MAKKIATDDAVFAAADDLVAAGQAPTMKAIQARTGGSFTTIRDSLGRWRSDRESERQAPPPDAVAMQAHAFARGVWALATEHAEVALRESRSAATAQATALHEDLNDAHSEIARLELECEQQSALLDLAQEQVAESKRREASQLERHKWLEDQLGALLEGRDAERSRVQHLERELAALAGRLASLNDEHRSLLQAVSGWRDSRSIAATAREQESKSG